MHLLQRHLRGDRPESRSKATFQQIPSSIRLQSPAAQGLSGGTDGLARRANFYEELGDHIDAHTVLGDERLRFAPLHFDPHHRHIHRRDVMQDRNDEGAAAYDDFFAAKTRPDEGGFLGRSLISQRKR